MYIYRLLPDWKTRFEMNTAIYNSLTIIGKIYFLVFPSKLNTTNSHQSMKAYKNKLLKQVEYINETDTIEDAQELTQNVSPSKTVQC